MNRLIIMILCGLLLSGCGGGTKPLPAAASESQAEDVSGEWVGWLQAAGPVAMFTPVHLNISQQGQALNVAAVLDSPLCFAITSGVGTGTLENGRLTLVLRLSDGGTLTIRGRDQTGPSLKGHLQDGEYVIAGGTCPGHGTVVLDKP